MTKTARVKVWHKNVRCAICWHQISPYQCFFSAFAQATIGVVMQRHFVWLFISSHKVFNISFLLDTFLHNGILVSPCNVPKCNEMCYFVYSFVAQIVFSTSVLWRLCIRHVINFKEHLCWCAFWFPLSCGGYGDVFKNLTWYLHYMILGWNYLGLILQDESLFQIPSS